MNHREWDTYGKIRFSSRLRKSLQSQTSPLRPVALLWMALAVGAVDLSVGAGPADADPPPSADAEESHPGLMAEALYSEAVIAFHRSQIDEAIRILNQVLAASPDHTDALELRALLFKNKGDEPQAIESYERLLKLRPESRSGPYHYELGVLFYQRKDNARSKFHLTQSLRHRFNSTVCRFFLGMIAFNENDNRRGEAYFRRVAEEGGGEIKLISLYYLGLIELRTSYPMGATRDLKAAKELALELSQDKGPSPTVKQISASVDQILAPFAVSQWFANATVLGQYNSNIALLPTSLTSSSQGVSGQGSGVLDLSGGVGWMTPPLRDFQWVASYRFSLNLNTNSNTKEYQFVTNTASLFFNYLPLGRFQTGVKAEGNFMFQDIASDPSGSSGSSYTYSKYLAGAEAGPYFRYQLSKGIQAELDLYFRPQVYYTEAYLSGTTVFSRLSFKGDFLDNYLNPSAYVEYEHDNADSSDYLSNSLGLGVSDTLKLTARDFVTPGVDLLASNYPENSEGRQDRQVTLHVDFVHTMNSHFSLLGNASYLRNGSTVADTFSYQQTVLSLGVSYNL